MTEVDDKTAPLGSATEEPAHAPASDAADVATGPGDIASPPAEDAAGVDDAIRPLEAGEIRARRRPRAVLLLWAFEAVAAMIVAFPVYAWANRAWGPHPDGDAELFRPGGYALLAWLDAPGAALSIVVKTAFVLLLSSWVMGQLVTGAVAASLATGRDRYGLPAKTSYALRAGVTGFFPMLGVAALTLATQGFVFGVGMLASSSLEPALTRSLGDARAFTGSAIVLAISFVAVLVVGIVGDLARVAVGRAAALEPRASGGAIFREGIVSAARTARVALGRATLAWAWRAVIAAGLVWLGALAGDLVGPRGGGILWLLFGFHQVTIAGRAALRASWLANALRLTLRARRDDVA